MTNDELIAALENPSDQTPADVLNEAFALAVGWKHFVHGWWHRRNEGRTHPDCPNFLTSIDAVLRDMPEGWRWLQLHNLGPDEFQAIIGKALDADNDLVESGDASTIQRAFMSAILRARG